MSLRFYMDENVRGPIVKELRRQGVDVLTVVEDRRTGLDDPAVMDWATEIERLLYSEDEDMLRESQRRQTQGTAFSGVVYGHHATSASARR